MDGASNNMRLSGPVLPECPVCMEAMTAPIFECRLGHSLCNICTMSLQPRLCPICRERMTETRNWQLEEIIAKAKYSCPNRLAGCKFTTTKNEIDGHASECIFRETACPLNDFSENCGWIGLIPELFKHFQERHASNLITSNSEEVIINNVDINENNHYFYLSSIGRFMFAMTMKIDVQHQMAFWTARLIGSKKVAQQYIYEIHVLNKKEPRKKVEFTHQCFSNSTRPDELYRSDDCAVMPLKALGHFVTNKKIYLKFLIKKSSAPPATTTPN